MEQAAETKMSSSSSTPTPQPEPESEYAGSGTPDDPYIVTFGASDPANPLNTPNWRKWLYIVVMALATLSVSFGSSAYTGGITGIIAEFDTSAEVASLGIALFVLGFAIGPLLWAPLSEMYGRRPLYIITFGCLTALSAGAAGANSIVTLVVLRFLAGSFGSSPLTNCGGVIADVFSAEQRAVASSLFAAMPFMGPVLGPICGGFVGEDVGWRWVQGVITIFVGVIWIIGSFVPETYAPVLLRRRAARLTKNHPTNALHLSALDAKTHRQTALHRWKIALSRPIQLLFKEPIVLSMTIYMAIIYGTLYMMFGAFPIVFEEQRGWSPGISGLAFVGIAVGMLIALVLNVLDNKRYVRACRASPDGIAPPEARLPPSMLGSVIIPIGLFWFAWTNGPSIHWSVCIIGSAPFGFGMVLVFLSIMNYLIDSYLIYAASVLAANSLLRSLFGAAFPLFTPTMYANLGIHWASSVPAFLALACVPFPWLFWKYGAVIRTKCPFAAEAAETFKLMARQKGAARKSGGVGQEKERENEKEEV